MGFTFLRLVCLALSTGSILLGGAILFLSYSWLQVDNYALVEAAPSGFVVGSMLIGAGLVALTLLAIRFGSTRRRNSMEDSPGPGKEG